MKGKLSSENLLNIVHNTLNKISGSAIKCNRKIELIDCLMSGYALFSLKYSSLLQFDVNNRKEGIAKNNLANLYRVKEAPSDTYMREVLDSIDPKKHLRKPFKKLFAEFQRSNYLKLFEFYVRHEASSIQ